MIADGAGAKTLPPWGGPDCEAQGHRQGPGARPRARALKTDKAPCPPCRGRASKTTTPCPPCPPRPPRSGSHRAPLAPSKGRGWVSLQPSKEGGQSPGDNAPPKARPSHFKKIILLYLKSGS